MDDKKRVFDSDGFYKALDSARQARGLNWKQVSQATQVSSSTLTRMAQDRRPDAESLAVLSAWSGLNPADFVAMGRQIPEDPLATITKCLRSDPNLNEESSTALDEMIKAAYQRLARKSNTTS